MFQPNKSANITFNTWRRYLDSEELQLLDSMDEFALEDAFFSNLTFGTGGLRGKLGLGPNRMNRYTVGKATQGLADYLNSNFKNPSVALCRDTRHGSEEFVRRVSEVLAGNNIQSYIFERVEPTPALSFAVRELGCSAGVNITASHNPAVYNGYKVYGPDGCQITADIAAQIQNAMDAIDCFSDVRTLPFNEAFSCGMVGLIPDSILDLYIKKTLQVSTKEDCSALRIVYTPLHGVGLECMKRVLNEINVSEVVEVAEQCVPDGDFPTCPYPNPEIREALELGLSYCNRVKPDLLLATDPDADRVGIAVLHEGAYELLSGNEVGILLLEYLVEKVLETKNDLSCKVACSTIVSSPMADDIALNWGFEMRRTLTGFKYIGEQVSALESEGRESDFLMGFEESYGYLAGTCVRDKDAVVSSMLICELAAHWKVKGMDLYEAMDSLYKHYGYWASNLLSQIYEGPKGAFAMKSTMKMLRLNTPTELGGMTVVDSIDYLESVDMPVINPSERIQKLPVSDVLELRLSGGSRVIFRPSGTEPKVKAYVFAKGSDRTKANSALQLLSDASKKILEGIIL